MRLPRPEWGYVERLKLPYPPGDPKHGKVKYDVSHARYWSAGAAQAAVDEIIEDARANTPEILQYVEFRVVKLGRLGPDPYRASDAVYERWCRQVEAECGTWVDESDPWPTEAPLSHTMPERVA